MKQTKLFLSLLMMLVFGIGNVWGEKVTDYTQLVSGQEYYIGATTSNTDYYLSIAKEDVGTKIKGTAVTDKTTATKVTAIGSGTAWAFKLSNGNYLSLNEQDANGTVDVVDDETKWTLSSKKSLCNMAINKHCLQKNTSSTNFGSYKSTSNQTNVWFETASSVAYTVTLNNNDVETTLTEETAGAGVTLPAPASTCTDWKFAGWAESAIAETTTMPTLIAEGIYKPTKDITLYAVYSKAETSDEGKKVVFNVADIAQTNGWSNSKQYLSCSIAPITITYAGGANDGKYYSNDKSWRIYQQGTITITSSAGAITNVTTTPTNTFTKQNDGSWKFSAEETIKFTKFTIAIVR